MDNITLTKGWPTRKLVPDIKNCLKRKRIFDALDTTSEQAAVWINGPPGAGKSWALASYLEARNFNPLWYQLDKRDNDPVFFFQALGKAIEELASHSQQIFSSQLVESDTDINSFAHKFFERAYEALILPFVLVFDNYPTLSSESPLPQLLEIAAASLPEDGRLFIVSRENIPDHFSSLQLKQSIVRMDHQTLEFTEEETGELLPVLGYEGISAETTASLHRQFQGWVGGMVLQLQQGTDAVIEATVGNYLQHELFSQLSKQQQDVLMNCAVLGDMPESMLTALTGNEHSIELISEFSRRGFFTRRYSQPYPSYTFFPIFQEFLLQKQRDNFSSEQRGALQKKAASLLTNLGHFEHAAELLQNADAFDEIEALIMQQAPALLEQGQFSRLQQLINSIPAEQHSAWIIYWSATASLPIDPHGARQHYEAALERFSKEKDLNGIYMSWAGIVDSFIFSWDDFKPLDHWISWMETFIQDNPGFPSPEIEARIVFAMFCSLMYRQPQHPDMPIWSQRLGSLLEHLPDKNRRIAIATHYVLYLAWMGKFELATAVIERLKPSANIDTVQPVNLIAWYQTEAMHAWLTANFDESQKSVQAGLALADKTGIHLWDFILRAQDAYLALESCSADQWPSYLEKILAIMDENGRLHQAHYYYLAALEALRQKNHERALLHVRRSLQAVVELGTPYPEALNCLAMGRILIELAEYDEAQSWLNRTATLAEQINSALLNFNFQLAQAELFYARGNDKAGSSALAQAMAIGAQKNYLNTDWWRPDAMCQLCIRALENNIEAGYIQKLIIKRKLKPDSPPLHLDNWPWRVKIYTLGRFGVLLDGTPVSVNGRGQNKPIELLKALIAMGGRDVSEAKISEALWPDSEGDSAHSAYTSTLSRLRKLLGSEVLGVHDGQLSLNDHLCWLDTWAYERSLGELEAMLSSSDTPQRDDIGQKMQRIFNLYHGPFMDKETPMGWMLAQKGRLQAKLLRSIKKLISFYSNSSQCKKVITLYEKALELDPLSEEYYRGLMRCHAGQGNSAEALAVYNHCRTTLNATFAIEPSEKTQQLYQLIKKGDQKTLNRNCERCAQASH